MSEYVFIRALFFHWMDFFLFLNVFLKYITNLFPIFQLNFLVEFWFWVWFFLLKKIEKTFTLKTARECLLFGIPIEEKKISLSLPLSSVYWMSNAVNASRAFLFQFTLWIDDDVRHTVIAWCGNSVLPRPQKYTPKYIAGKERHTYHMYVNGYGSIRTLMKGGSFYLLYQCVLTATPFRDVSTIFFSSSQLVYNIYHAAEMRYAWRTSVYRS